MFQMVRVGLSSSMCVFKKKIWSWFKLEKKNWGEILGLHLLCQRILLTLKKKKKCNSKRWAAESAAVFFFIFYFSSFPKSLFFSLSVCLSSCTESRAPGSGTVWRHRSVRRLLAGAGTTGSDVPAPYIYWPDSLEPPLFFSVLFIFLFFYSFHSHSLSFFFDISLSVVFFFLTLNANENEFFFFRCFFERKRYRQ